MSPSSAPASTPPIARSTAQLVTDRTFGPWFWGNVVSNSGNWLFNVTAAVVVYQLSRSALLVGMVSVAQFAPLLFLSPFAGALSDRFDRRRLLLLAQVVAATSASALAIVAVAAGTDGLPGAWPILLAAFGIGVGQTIAAPALQALVPALVDDVDLESGVSLTSLTFSAGRALGPAVSGGFLATVGAEAAFVVNALTFLALIVALLVIQPRPRPRRRSVDRSVRAGLRYVRADPVVVSLLLGVAATGFSVDPVITLSPALADQLGGGETLVALLVSGFGLAAAVAASMSGRFQRRFDSLTVAAYGGATTALGLTVAALAPAAWVAVVGFSTTGVGFVLALTSFTAVLQRRLPDELRGRVMALWSVAFLGNRPVAAVIDGAAADLAGPRWALAIGVAVAISGVALAVRTARLLARSSDAV